MPRSAALPPIIQVHDISKKYQIGSFDRSTFREEFSQKLRAFLLRCKAKLSGHAPEPENKYFWALKNVSFEVHSGEVLGIIGKNGSGKSTLLKILSRITKPTSGKAVVNKSLVSMLEVGIGFHPELTGRENVYLSGTIIGMKKVEIDKKFDEIVEFSGIGGFIDTPVKRYSSGMYVRLAFSVSTQLVSDIILIDEVLAVGDAEFQRKSLAKIDELRQRGKTIILVSHNLFSLEQLCDRVMWLKDGKVKKIGKYDTVVKDYLNQMETPVGEVKFPQNSGSHGAHLLKAFSACEGAATAEIPYNKPINIHIEYQVDHPIDDLKLGCRIWNHMNAPIFHTATNDSLRNGSKLGQPGCRTVSVEIPGFWLAPEEYFAEIGIWSPDVEHHHHVIKAFSFKVVSSSDQTPQAEEFRPQLNWNIISSESNSC